jgi:hypothetical protein
MVSFGLTGLYAGRVASKAVNALKQLLQRCHCRHDDAYRRNRPALAFRYSFDQIGAGFLDFCTHHLRVAACGTMECLENDGVDAHIRIIGTRHSARAQSQSQAQLWICPQLKPRQNTQKPNH